MPANLAPHPGAEAVEIALPAAGMALQGDWYGVEQLAVTARAALHPEPISFAGEVGDLLKARASHASAMPSGRPIANGIPGQSRNRSVDCGGGAARPPRQPRVRRAGREQFFAKTIGAQSNCQSP